MKSINIPAQVTTVEDRIVGNLTLTQLSLLVSPIFVDFAIYGVMPKAMHLYVYKFLLMAFVLLSLFTLAIRVKGKLVLFWALTLIKFKFKNKLYVFNKNTLLFRTIAEPDEVVVAQSTLPALIPNDPIKALNDHEAENIIKRLGERLCFIEEKRGRLYVYISKD